MSRDCGVSVASLSLRWRFTVALAQNHVIESTEAKQGRVKQGWPAIVPAPDSLGSPRIAGIGALAIVVSLPSRGTRCNSETSFAANRITGTAARVPVAT
jgi:hypothetical protein